VCVCLCVCVCMCLCVLVCAYVAARRGGLGMSLLVLRFCVHACCVHACCTRACVLHSCMCVDEHTHVSESRVICLLI